MIVARMLAYAEENTIGSVVLKTREYSMKSFILDLKSDAR